MQSTNVYQMISPILQQIKLIHSRKMTAFVHCSKINNCIQVLKQIPPIIDEMQLQFPNKCLQNSQILKVNDLTTVFSKLEDLFIQCCSSNCFQFLVSSPVGEVKRDLKKLRDSAASLFEQLDMPRAAEVMMISDDEINAQDIVDMKRVAQMLAKLAQQNRKDAEPILEKRFASLEKLGIATKQVNVDNIFIPELPSNLQIIIQHSDIELGKEIGSGQTGIVKIGLIKSTHQRVAVKIIQKTYFTASEIESFRREILTLSVLKHPNLLKFYGYTQEAPLYIMTEYLSNGSLYECIHQSPELLNPTQRSIIAVDVANGLVYLHSQGIIHRDMKTLNVLLDKNLRAKICDFGMVKTRSSSSQPMTGLIGTAHWMAPEVLMSKPIYDEKVDVYSFGIILWELLTGQVPYGNMSTAKIAISVVEKGLRPEIPENTPPGVRELITMCWDTDPNKRPSMDFVLSELLKPECHFARTNEAVFQSQMASLYNEQNFKPTPRDPLLSKRHSSFHSNKRPPSLGGLDIKGIIASINIHNYDYPLILQFMHLLENKSSAEKASAEGACELIAKILEEKMPFAPQLVEKLEKCQTPQIFDIPVIRSLLSFSDNKNTGMRFLAISALVTATKLRMDFLKSYPSYLVQLLAFMKQPFHNFQYEESFNEVITSFFDVIYNLISISSAYPDHVIQILIWLLDRNELTDFIIPCIISLLRYEEGACELTKNNFIFLLRNIDKLYPIVDAYISLDKPKSGSILEEKDKEFVNMLFIGRVNKKIFEYIIKTAGMKRFAFLIISMLPINVQSNSTCSSVGTNYEKDYLEYARVYINLTQFSELLPLISKIPEFYEISSQMILHEKYEQICNILRSIDIDTNALKKTNLSQTLVNSINESNDPDNLILLMGASFSILNTAKPQEFIKTIKRLEYFLFSDTKQLRMPSFLCLSSISTFASELIDYSKLVPAAAYYVNIDSSLMRENAAFILRDHISDQNINLNYVFQIFVDSFREDLIDNFIQIAIESFTHVCTRPEISHELLQRMSQIYLRVQQK